VAQRQAFLHQYGKQHVSLLWPTVGYRVGFNSWHNIVYNLCCPFNWHGVGPVFRRLCIHSSIQQQIVKPSGEKISLEAIAKWLKQSGLLVNDSKTEDCLFHIRKCSAIYFCDCVKQNWYHESNQWLGFHLNQGPPGLSTSPNKLWKKIKHSTVLNWSESFLSQMSSNIYNILIIIQKYGKHQNWNTDKHAFFCGIRKCK
jgi:hypothetical protein